jgi:carbonic anhydrase/acetyltransferase-like protein (isoleucine patch superfamily)
MIAALGDRSPELIGTGHFIAPDASVIGTIRLQANASIWFNSVLRGDNECIEVGENSNVQDGCVLHTDPGFPLSIGKGVTIGHKVMLHGCEIGDNTLIGIGSIILNGAKIGRDCLVGANSLITEGKQFPAGVLILGSPAKVVRELEAAEIEQIRFSAQVYVDNSKRFLEQLKVL